MELNDWLVDNFKIKISLKESLGIGDSFLSKFFLFDKESIDINRNENELVELYFDEQIKVLYKIQYSFEKNTILFTLSEKNLENKSIVFFRDYDFKNIILKVLNFVEKNFKKINFSLSVYIQDDDINKEKISNIFNKNNFNLILNDKIESAEVKISHNENLNNLKFKYLKSFLFLDAAKLSDVLVIKKLGKNKVLFFKQDVVIRGGDNLTKSNIVNVFSYIEDQIFKI